MTTKQDYYQFLKSAKEKRCGGLSGISHLTKNEMAQMAYKLGYSATDIGRRSYIPKNDPTLKQERIEIQGRRATQKSQPRRQQQQEEKKEETWQEMKARGQKILQEGKDLMKKMYKKQETTERDLTKSKEFKKSHDLQRKGLSIMTDADILRRKVLGLPTIEEERKQKIEEAKKRKEARDKKKK